MKIGIPPLIKWPGGKRGLVSSIVISLPEKYGSYFEPFLGGGALFFAIAPASAVLSDENLELMNLYRHVQDAPLKLIEEVSKFENTEEGYYRVRKMRPDTALVRAARLYFLTRLSFNGIYRENERGEFNVPYGKKHWLSVIDCEAVVKASQALRNARLIDGDFESAVAEAGMNDLVYFDPPYTVAHNKNGFVKYNKKIFSWNDQERLAFVAETLVLRGCHVVVSNADHSSIDALYLAKGVFQKRTVERISKIAAKSSARVPVTESLFVGGTSIG